MVKAEIQMSSSGRDTDCIVRICDVYPDGRSMLVVEYARRARYRLGFERQELLQPGEPAAICFDVGWTSITFNAGHRIRVLVASSGAPLYEPNHWQDGSVQTVAVPEAGGVAVTNSLYHGTTTRIIAPVVSA
jgi:predicted acyl esterase